MGWLLILGHMPNVGVGGRGGEVGKLDAEGWGREVGGRTRELISVFKNMFKKGGFVQIKKNFPGCVAYTFGKPFQLLSLR